MRPSSVWRKKVEGCSEEKTLDECLPGVKVRMEPIITTKLPPLFPSTGTEGHQAPRRNNNVPTERQTDIQEFRTLVFSEFLKKLIGNHANFCLKFTRILLKHYLTNYSQIYNIIQQSFGKFDTLFIKLFATNLQYYSPNYSQLCDIIQQTCNIIQ